MPYSLSLLCKDLLTLFVFPLLLPEDEDDIIVGDNLVGDKVSDDVSLLLLLGREALNSFELVVGKEAMKRRE